MPRSTMRPGTASHERQTGFSMARSTEFNRAELLGGMKDILPLAIGAGIYGLAFGLLAAQTGMTGLRTGFMGAAVFAGSSQIVMIERVAAGAGAMTALLAAIALNLRLILITASLRDELAGRPIWQIVLGVHVATDENWVMMHAARNSGRQVGYWYMVGGGFTLLAIWIATTTAGATLAAIMPEPRALGMDFAFTAAFIAILRALWRGTKVDALPWLVAIGIASLVCLGTPLDPSWGLVIAGISGAITAGLRGHG